MDFGLSSSFYMLVTDRHEEIVPRGCTLDILALRAVTGDTFHGPTADGPLPDSAETAAKLRRLGQSIEAGMPVFGLAQAAREDPVSVRASALRSWTQFLHSQAQANATVRETVRAAQFPYDTSALGNFLQQHLRVFEEVVRDGPFRDLLDRALRLASEMHTADIGTRLSAAQAADAYGTLVEDIVRVVS